MKMPFFAVRDVTLVFENVSFGFVLKVQEVVYMAAA